MRDVTYVHGRHQKVQWTHGGVGGGLGGGVLCVYINVVTDLQQGW